MGGVGTWMRRVDRGGMLLFLDESLGGGFSSLEAGQGDIHMNLGNIRLIRAAPDNRQESHVRHDNQRCDQVESSGFLMLSPVKERPCRLYIDGIYKDVESRFCCLG